MERAGQMREEENDGLTNRHSIRGFGRHNEVGHECVPPSGVGLPPGGPFSAETFPSRVHDVEPSRAVPQIHERQLDIGGVAAVAMDVPEVAEPKRWAPKCDLAPVDLDAVGCPLEQATP